MDKVYADTVRLLLTAAPDVFVNGIFAMKGGTAINLFVQDMPRLSVDIDVVYTPWQTPREQALKAIGDELDAISAITGSPIFVGHHWFSGHPKIESPKLACLDWSAAKDGPLVAYQWDGESELTNDKLAWVGPLSR
jgi:Nucleotidyl transferase AbiEii toxin, Type IV TA system